MDCLLFVAFITGAVFARYIWRKKPAWRQWVLIIAGFFAIILSKYTQHADPKDIGNNAWLLDILLVVGVASVFVGVFFKKIFPHH